MKGQTLVDCACIGFQNTLLDRLFVLLQAEDIPSRLTSSLRPGRTQRGERSVVQLKLSAVQLVGRIE